MSGIADKTKTIMTDEQVNRDPSYNLRSSKPKVEPCASLCNGTRQEDGNGGAVNNKPNDNLNKPDDNQNGGNPNGKPGQGGVGEENGAIGDNEDGGPDKDHPYDGEKLYKNPVKHGQEESVKQNLPKSAVEDNNVDDVPVKNGRGKIAKQNLPEGAVGDNNVDDIHDKYGDLDIKNINDAVGHNDNPAKNPDGRDQGDLGEENNAAVDANNVAGQFVGQDGLHRRPLHEEPVDEEANRGNEVNNINENEEGYQHQGFQKARTGLQDLVDGIKEECSYQMRKAYRYIRNTTMGEFFALLWMYILNILHLMRRKITELGKKLWEKRWTIMKSLGGIVLSLLLFRIIAMVVETQDEVQDFQEFVKENNAKYSKIIQKHHAEVDELQSMNDKLRSQLKVVEDGQETLIGDGGEIAAIKKEIINVKNEFENFMVESQAHLIKVQDDMQKEVGQIRDDVGNVREDHKRIELALNSIEYNIRNIKNCGLLSRLFGWC